MPYPAPQDLQSAVLFSPCFHSEAGAPWREFTRHPMLSLLSNSDSCLIWPLSPDDLSPRLLLVWPSTAQVSGAVMRTDRTAHATATSLGMGQRLMTPVLVPHSANAPYLSNLPAND